MPKHKSEDYKLSAVQYYLENDVSYVKTCEIFKCSERSLKRWIDRYLLENDNYFIQLHINILQFQKYFR